MRVIKRFVKVVFWAIAGVFALAVMAVVGAKLYLSDERLAQLVEDTLNDVFAGHFEVGEVHWSLPFHFVIDDVSIDDPGGRPAIRASHVDARLRWRALLHGTLAIDDIAAHGLDIRVLALAENPERLGIAEAFTPKAPAKKADEDNGPPLTLDFHGTTLDRVEFIYDDGTTQLIVSGGHIENVTFGMRGDILDIDGDVEAARFTLRTNGYAYDGGPVRLHTEAFDIDLGDALGFATKKTRVIVDGVTIDVSGDLHFPQGSLPRGTLVADAFLPLDHPLLRGALPKGMTGRGQLAVHAATDGRKVDLTARGTDASLSGLAIELVTLTGTVDGDRIDIERLRAELEGGTASVSGEIELRAPMAHDLTAELERFPVAETARVFADSNALLPQRVSGRLKARGNGLTDLSSHVEAELRAEGLPDALSVVPDPLRVELEGDLTPAHANIARLVAMGDGAVLEAHGRIPFTEDGPIDANLTLTHKRPSTTLAKARAQAPVQLESLVLTARAQGKLSRLVAEALLEAQGVSAEGIGPASVRAPLRVEGGVLTLSAATVGIGGGEIVIDGTVGVMDQSGRVRDAMPLAATVSAHNVALASITNGHAAGRLVIDGELGGTLQAPRGQLVLGVDDLAARGVVFSRARAVAVLEPEHLTVRELALDPKDGGDLQAKGRYTFASAKVDGEVTITDLPLVAVLALSAPDVPLRGSVASRLAISGPVAAPSITGQVRVSELASGNVVIGTLTADISDAKIVSGKGQALQVTAQLRGPLGKADVDAGFVPATGHIEAKLTVGDVGVANALSAAKLDLPLDGRFVATADLQGELPYPSVNARLEVADISLDGVAPATNVITVVVTTNTADTRYDARVDFGEILTASLEFWPARGPVAELRATFDDFRASAFSPKLAKAGYELTLSGNTHVRYNAPSAVDGTLTLDRLVASVDRHAVQLARPTTISFQGTNVDIPGFTLEGAGSTLTVKGALRDGDIDGEMEGDLDLAVLGPFVTAVSEPTGVLHVLAKASGRLASPELTGEVSIAKEVRGRPRGIAQELVVTNGRVTLDGDSIVVSDFAGRLETGSFEVRGRIGLRDWRPDSYDVRLLGRKLAFQSREVRVEADADLRLSGRGRIPDVAGEIVVLTGRYSKKFALRDFNFVGGEPDTSAPLSQTMPFLADMELDLHATSREDVEVAVDASAFAIALPLQLDLQVRGTPLSPSIGGRITAQAGSIRFPEATLTVQETLVSFTPGLSPAEGANIQLVAEGEVPAKGEDSTADEIYLVSMTLSGTLAEMHFDLSASPGLDRNQTLALLITGKAGFDQLFYGTGTTGTASSRSTSPEVDAAIALAGAGVTGPLTGFVENQLEDRINLRVDLSASFTSDQVRVTARKELTPRLRLEGSVQRALQASGTNLNVATATFVLGNRWFLQAIAQAAQGNSVLTDNSVVRPRSDNRLEMRYRLIGD